MDCNETIRMESDLQASTVADQVTLDAVLCHQDGLETKICNVSVKMHNMSTMMLQLSQQMQNLSQFPPIPIAPAPTLAPAVLPILQRTLSSLPERFGGESEKMRTFIAQYELLMGTRAAEFPTDWFRVSFIQSLLIVSAPQRALSIIKCNDPIIDNYQNCMENFRGHFRNLIRETTATYQIHELDNT